MDSSFEYDWLKKVIRKKQINVGLHTGMMIGAWVVAVALSIFAFFFEDGNFSRSGDFASINIAELSPDGVKAHPYIRVQDGCLQDDPIFFSKNSTTEYYYLLGVCDSGSKSFNQVVVATDEGLANKLAKGDTLDVMNRFLTGKLMVGLPKNDKVADFIQNSWHIPEVDTYTLVSDYTPTDERNGDIFVSGVFLLVAFGVFSFMVVQRRSAIRELNAWKLRFEEKYPNG